MDDPDSTAPPNDYKAKRLLWHELIMAMIGIIITVVAGYIVFVITERNRTQELVITEQNRAQELNIKYAELGLAILRADSKDENTAKIRS